ncbi:hypothetical protein ACKWTF_015873 [Chironomus riparius]
MKLKLIKLNQILTNITSKSSQILQILTILVLLPHQSTQLAPAIQTQTTIATCIYRYDAQNLYTCDLHNATDPYPDGVLEIIGSHLPGRTDVDVKALIHVNSQFRQFNGEVLRKFENLEVLSLSELALWSVNQNAFEICGQLEVLYMRLNFQLRSLPAKMLQNCWKLRFIDFDFCRMQTIPDDLFGNSTAIEQFSVRSNQMTSFPDNVLQNMTNLRIFDVQSNQITTLNRNNFVNAINLEEFNVGWNKIGDEQEVLNLLNGHLGLKLIRLDNNRFRMFNFNFFSQFQRLEVLAVGGNQNLTEIAWQALPASLIYLRVREIAEEIPENAFNHLTNLTELYLTGFGITNLQQDTFKELINLRVLHVTETSISTLNPQLFQSLINLHTLSMQMNQIEDLPDGIFTPLKSLGLGSFQRVLTMSNNRITRLPIDIFGQHPHLFHIDFSFNQITGIQRGIFSRFNPFMAQAEFIANKCTSASLWNETNLDQNKELEWCFNSFEGITTTTQNGVQKRFRGFEVILMILVGIGNALMYF